MTLSTSMYKSDFLNILQERGFIYQMTHAKELDAQCAQGSIRGYWGCDATASSLHVGNLMGLMALRWFQDTGHVPILLLGGATTRIGDPSGRDSSRTLLSQEDIHHNMQGIRKSFEKIIPPERALWVDNAAWFDSLLYISFLRDIGVHFSVNRMMSFEHVKSRLEQNLPLSFIEFNYSVMQAYDFLKLYQDLHCLLQFGGSDQWGNIVSGVDLVRRVAKVEVYGLTWPLLETASGAKMGKSVKGAIWLNENLFSPYAYWQFWRNVDDKDVFRFFKIFTMMPSTEFAFLENLCQKDIVAAKILLADEVTTFLHGKEVLSAIHEAVHQVFSETNLSMDVLEQLPTFFIKASDFTSKVLVLDILESLAFVSSRREGRQKIREGAVKLNNRVLLDELYALDSDDFRDESVLKLSFGAKKHGLIVLK